MTLGSLFDGSGGFPLGGIINGIEPRWASEIAPFPIMVTHRRMPSVKHYGDVSTLNGADLEPVDIITFGSPCQGLSNAGLRKGIEDDERSNLFYQAIRIIKEMREATHGRYPRYAVWENVPGAFSSNGGEDFRSVLQAFCEIKQAVDIPRPKKWGGVDASWETISPSHGDAWTLSTGESPKDAEESTLSQILMAEVPTRFCLSPRACQGILARAERRGKTIPPMLMDALAECMSATAKTQESRNCTESPRQLQLSTAQGGATLQ